MREQLLLRTPDEPFFRHSKKWMHIFKKLENDACCASPFQSYFLLLLRSSFYITWEKKSTKNSFSSKYLLEKKHALVLHILLISSL